MTVMNNNIMAPGIITTLIRIFSKTKVPRKVAQISIAVQY